MMRCELAVAIGLTVLAGCTSKPEAGKAADGGSSTTPAPPPAVIRIPGGKFAMGSADPRVNALPITQVILKPYYMDRTEVSVAAYQACVDAKQCSDANLTKSISGLDEFCNWGKPGRGVHPINCVDWSQAKQYCEAQGGRLPTEAEWEFAARGTDGRTYPWGNTEADPTKALFTPRDSNRIQNDRVIPTGHGTAPVESYERGASPFGLLNMAGNVSEWVADEAYVPYPGGTIQDPKPKLGSDPSSSQWHAYRGGGWLGPAFALGAAMRFNSIGNTDWYRAAYLGFRCARDAP